MPQREVQHPATGSSVPAWESAPWIPEDRIVEEPKSAPEASLHLSDEHVVELQESDSIRRVA